MVNIEQKAETYIDGDINYLVEDIEKHITEGWLVRSCSYLDNQGVLVIYERPLETWN